MGKKKSQDRIVTTFGMDGACSAAMGLQTSEDAEVLITSTSRVGTTLSDLAQAAGRGATVHVCGLGLGDEPEAVLAALDRLTGTGAEVVWYCGRGYLDDVANELASRCTAIIKPCASNTEAVFRHLSCPKNRRTTLLLDLADEFVRKADDIPDDHAWWQDLLQRAAERYFKYEDGDAFPSSIRTLAGLAEATSLDEREVKRFRASSGKALPLGNSRAMKRLRALILRLAPLDEPVLVCGPSGTGKEMVSRLLHEASPRADGNFVPVNCAILSTSSDLAHDRLFGHTAGSYTGAKEDGKGAFEAADDGTLFLDEVAELPTDVQTQLLRVLEEGTVLPLGTMEPKPVNVRVVAATNRTLAQMVEEGTFRLDLYHRLNVLSLDVPPLCQRREDMKSIANAVIHQLGEKGHALKISKADWQAIHRYTWPGNIRQFINILKRAAYMKIRVADALATEIRRSWPAGDAATAPEATGIAHLDLFWPTDPDGITPEDEVRKAYMRRCLTVCDGNWTLTARKLGVATNTLRKWLDA